MESPERILSFNARELDDMDETSETPNTTPPAPVSNGATPDREAAIDESLGNELKVDSQTKTEESENGELKVDDGDDLDDGIQEDEELLTLPLSKIKKIFKMDPDYLAASKGAVYATGLATELFIQYFVEQASLLAKMDRRKKIQYKDLSNAVSSHDSLSFLSDTVPKAIPIRELMENNKINLSKADQVKLSKEENKATGINDEVVPVEDVEKNTLPKGQQQLNFPISKPTNPPFKKSVIKDLVTLTDENDSEKLIEDVTMAT
ncbi:uncharacterized protein PRCAT00003922001 [Priceomyces carsonii]|uniref:uncharacterized protein n=1 Tax=Priceomyces carsonii TaxID=28549 RepID=UPI002EDAC464|nr:unnamed protein product [Priceomyces carsonii]